MGIMKTIAAMAVIGTLLAGVWLFAGAAQGKFVRTRLPARLATAGSAPALDRAAARNATWYVARALAATGARMNGFEVHDWSNLSSRAESLPTLRAEAERVVRAFGMKRTGAYEHDAANDRVALVTGTYDGNATASVELASMQLTASQMETVLVARIADTGSGRKPPALAEVAGAYLSIERATRAVAAQPDVNVTLFGSLANMLGRAARASRVAAALAADGAAAQPGMADAYTTSVTGFSPAPVPYDIAGQTRFNLQVALFENNFHHSTRVLVGSPIITVEY
jgi:hypothetical protein